MKKTFWIVWAIIAGLILSSAWLEAGRIQSYHMMIIGQEQPSGWPGFAYDLWENFEDALGAGWTNADTNDCDGGAGACLDTQSSVRAAHGSQSMEVDLDSIDQDDPMIYYNSGTNDIDVSVGFALWLPATDWGLDLYIYPFHHGDGFLSANNIVRLQWFYDDGTPDAAYLRIRGTGYSANMKTITAYLGSWIWVTIDINNNDTCTLRIFELGGAEIDSGTSVTCTGNNRTGTNSYYALGIISPTYGDVDGDFDIDDFVYDVTDQTFPLGP